MNPEVVQQPLALNTENKVCMVDILPAGQSPSSIAK
jgi:hypothetical protein